jgi:hypothetical protein
MSTTGIAGISIIKDKSDWTIYLWFALIPITFLNYFIIYNKIRNNNINNSEEQIEIRGKHIKYLGVIGLSAFCIFTGILLTTIIYNIENSIVKSVIIIYDLYMYLLLLIALNKIIIYYNIKTNEIEPVILENIKIEQITH